MKHLSFALATLFSLSLHAELESVQVPDDLLERISDLQKNPKQVLGVELLEVSGVKGNLGRLFGHMMLRFVDSDQDPLNDLVFSYYPETYGAIPGAWSSIVGAYDLALEIGTVEKFANEYIVGDSIFIRRLPLLSNQSLREAVVRESLERLYDKETRGKYLGFSNNCLGVLLGVLGDAGFPFENPQIFLPAVAKDYLADNGISLYPYVQADPPSDLTRSNSRALKTYLAQSFEALPTEIYEFCDSAACAQIVLTHLSKRDGGVSDRRIDQIVNFKTQSYRKVRTSQTFRKGGTLYRRIPLQWGAIRAPLDNHYEWLRQERLRSKKSRSSKRR